MPLTEEEMFARLAALGISTTTVRHPPVFTVAEAKARRGALPGTHTKNLLLKENKGALWLIVAEEDRTLALNSLRRRLGASRLSFAKAQVLRETLGVEPGSVTPLAVINDQPPKVTVVLDSVLHTAERLNVHPLTNTATTALRPCDLIRFLEACGHPPRIVALENGGGT